MTTLRRARARLACPLTTLAAAVLALGSLGTAQAQSSNILTLASPSWEIALSDYGYSDYLGDLTPGYQGREYLSGEWAGAIGYGQAGTLRKPTWLEPNFVYPDWTTNSNFQVVSAITAGSNNAQGLPTASSVIQNDALRITQRFEIIDTRTGMAMGIAAASASQGASLVSNRYVLQQTYTFENIANTRLDNLQFFQFLHGLTSQSGVYDNRAHAGAMANYRYDTTLSGDAGGGANQFDYIAFHSKVAPTAIEIGSYGVENNGVDDHSTGKPVGDPANPFGTHLSVEGNTLNGQDSYAPAVRWVAGAQRYDLGSLQAGQSVQFDVALSILTGYQVADDTRSGSIGGGSGQPGGVDYLFNGTHGAGQFFLHFEREDAEGLAALVNAGEFGPLSFSLPGDRLPLWELEYDGSFSGLLTLTFGFDPTLLPPGVDASQLRIYHWSNGAWVDLGGRFDLATGTITVSTDSLSPFALGVAAVPEPGTLLLMLGGVLVLGRRLRRTPLRR